MHLLSSCSISHVAGSSRTRFSPDHCYERSNPREPALPKLSRGCCNRAGELLQPISGDQKRDAVDDGVSTDEPDESKGTPTRLRKEQYAKDHGEQPAQDQ